MRIFKTPLRCKPILSEISPNGNLLLAYLEMPRGGRAGAHLKMYEFDASNSWKKHVTNRTFSHRMMSELEVTSFVPRIHAMMNYPDQHTLVNIEIPPGRKNRFNASGPLNLLTGKIENCTTSELCSTWHAHPENWICTCGIPFAFVAATFGMVLYEYTNAQETRLKIYTAKWDWAICGSGLSPVPMKFKYFGYFTTSIFDFGTDPNRCVVYSKFEPNPRAQLFYYREQKKKLISIELPMPKRWRMFSAVPVSETLTVGLIGHENKSTGELVRFYGKDGRVQQDFKLPSRAHTLHVSPDFLTLTAIGYDQVVQIDLDQ